VERARVLVVTGVLALVAAVHLSYQYLIAPLYSYAKLTYASPNPAIYTTLIVLIAAMALILPLSLARPADFVLWVLYVVMVIPSLLISYLARTLDDTTQLMMGFVITACFSGVILIARAPSGTLSRRITKFSPRAFWAIIIVISIATYGGLAASGALRLAIPSLTQVYGVRAAFSGHLTSNRLVGYLVPNQANVINPLVIATGLYLRRWWMVVLGMVGELVIYAAAAYKTVLFAIPVLVVVAFLFRKGRPQPGALIPWAFVGVISVSAVVDFIVGTPWVTSLFTRRFMDLPGFLTGAWVSVFSHGPKAMYAYSFLSPFFDYPYPAAPAYVVAAQVLGSPETNANANLFGDGYANFGWWGMAFESVVLAVILLLANKLSHGIPLMVVIVLFVMPSVTLANTSVLTAMITHGVVAALLIMAFAPRSIWARAPEPVGESVSSPADPTQRLRPASARPARTPVLGGVGMAMSASDGLPGSWWQRGKRSSVHREETH
jgi:hypothetical protein